MMTSKLKIASACTTVLLVLSGCGGSDDSTAATSTLPSLDNVPVAEATVENATEAVDTVFEAENVSTLGTGLLAVADVQTVGFNSVAFALNQLQAIQEAGTDVHALNEAVSESQPCTGGGSIAISGNVTQTTSTLTMVASNCVEGDMTVNGTIGATLTLSSAGEISYMKLTFNTDYTATGAVSMMVHGGSYMALSFDALSDPTTGLSSGTATSSIWFEALGQNMRYDDLTIKFANDSFGDGTECYRNGRIYINNLSAYMDIDSTYDTNCLDPFTTSSGVLISGSTRLLGSNGSTVLIDVVSPDTFLATDENGNTLETTN